jgi:hypothetical protein
VIRFRPGRKKTTFKKEYQDVTTHKGVLKSKKKSWFRSYNPLYKSKFVLHTHTDTEREVTTSDGLRTKKKKSHYDKLKKHSY